MQHTHNVPPGWTSADYLDLLAKPGTWASNFEAATAAHALGIQVVVYMPGQDELKAHHNPDGGATVQLLNIPAAAAPNGGGAPASAPLAAVAPLLSNCQCRHPTARLTAP
jgi:hypothetical protein